MTEVKIEKRPLEDQIMILCTRIESLRLQVEKLETAVYKKVIALNEDGTPLISENH